VYSILGPVRVQTILIFYYFYYSENSLESNDQEDLEEVGSSGDVVVGGVINRERD
jgi:hypothetical protein